MIKFLLVMQICSVVNESCLKPFSYSSFQYATYFECASVGYLSSLKYLNNMETDFINNNQIIITFRCQKIINS
jgi:hypothetical protein